MPAGPPSVMPAGCQRESSVLFFCSFVRVGRHGGRHGFPIKNVGNDRGGIERVGDDSGGLPTVGMTEGGLLTSGMPEGGLNTWGMTADD